MLEIVPLPAFRDNYIWALQVGRALAVVDPGDAAPVLAHAQANALELTAVLITHHHADHCGGLAALRGLTGARVFGPAEESITGLDVPLRGGESIRVPGIDLALEVLAVPGHTRGHLAYLGAGALFCGDTLFGAGCGRLFEGTPAQMFASLARLAALPDATRVYCAHEYTTQNLGFARLIEPDSAALRARSAKVASQRAAGQPSVPSTVGEEKATNPFLRCAEPAVRAAVAERAAGDDPLAVFTALRSWRNEF
jgi:hydroxyacylglutathione hydrolase